MTSRILAVCALLGAALAFAPTKDAAAADDPALAALVAEALADNPDLRTLQESLTAARALPAQAGALPDPVLSLGYVNEGWSPSLGAMPDSTLSVMVGQDLPWPGKRALRSRLAASSGEQAAQQLARARLGVAAGVRRAYQALAQSRLLLELVREQSQLLGQIEGVARARYTVGQGAQQDVLRTQVEVTRIGQLEAEQRAQEAERLAELNRLLGRRGAAGIEARLDATPSESRPLEPLEPLLERLRAISPELASAHVSLDAARVAVDLARKEFKPDLGLRAGYMNRGGLDPMWQAGVSLNLPLARGRRQAAVAEAEARVRAAGQRVQAVEAQLRLRTQQRLARLQAVERMTALYGEGIVPQGRLSVEAALASYQAGRTPFIAVLESLGTLYGDRGAYIRLLTARAQLMASLDEASLEDSPPGQPMAEPAAPARAGAMSAGASMQQ